MDNAMKRIELIISIAASIILTGCSKGLIDREINEEANTRIYEAGFNDVTRTSVAADGKVSWAADDVIRYYTANGHMTRQVTVTEDCTKAIFPLVIDDEAQYIVAVYGGDALISRTSTGVSISGAGITAEQSGVLGASHVAVTVPTDIDATHLTFTNVVSYVKFTLDRTDVSKVVFKSNDATHLNNDGDVIYVSFESGLRSVYNDNSRGSNSITVNTGGAGTFYLATLPCTLKKGFTIECFDSSDESLGEIEYNKSVSIRLNSILNLGTLDGRLPKVYRNLSDAGVANCYIVTKAGDYKIKVVKGNTDDPVGDVASAGVLWETFGTGTGPEAGDLVSDVKYEDGYIYFSASALKGNASIAARDKSGKILWSWHIWMTDQPVDQVYYNNAGTMMDRNLGATSVTPGDVRANGLFYQWGRKDPFISYDGINSTTLAASTTTWSTTRVKMARGFKGELAIQYANANPTVLFENTDGNTDWYSANDEALLQDQLWSSSKTEYDPCPAGYRVPSGDANSIWVKTCGSNEDFYIRRDDANYGVNFGTTGNQYTTFGNYPVIWYPAAGEIGTRKQSGFSSIYWTCTLDSGEGHYPVYFYYEAMAFPCTYTASWRSYAYSVRCQKINSTE